MQMRISGSGAGLLGPGRSLTLAQTQVRRDSVGADTDAARVAQTGRGRFSFLPPGVADRLEEVHVLCVGNLRPKAADGSDLQFLAPSIDPRLPQPKAPASRPAG